MTDIRLVVADFLGGEELVDLELKTNAVDTAWAERPEFDWTFFGRFFPKKFFGRSYFSKPGITVRHKVIPGRVIDLDETEELQTAILVALGTDKLADESDVLPDPDSSDRRGWWADMDAQEIWDGWPIGTKNWLLSRAKITDSLSSEGNAVARARQYTIDAIQPFIDRRVASAFNVNATRIGLDKIEVEVTIYRGPKEEINLRYQALWPEAA